MSAFSCGCNLNAGCCGCCSALRPRYKRLVDNIFPIDPEDGLVRNNMDKLTFYALSSPEKLDRIGDYLAQRLNRDIARHKLGYVVIAMEALDQLLVACHAQTLNLFVESFLKMVQKLLECHEPDLQVLATQSFIKFANIEEDTPSYHRRYDFFVSKFSSMCHNNDSDPEVCMRVRVAGLKGIQGVVRKTVSDDLQVNIWDQSHMDKIVPSLLFNMHEANSSQCHETPESPHEDEHPASLAESCLRDLMCRAAFGNIKYVLRPVLRHLDLHELWVPNDFAVKCFKIIMYSVQAQYSYVVVQMLISHLDEHSKDEATIRASIVNVLLQTVLIAAGGSIGPSVLEVFNTMLRHLRLSVSLKTTDEKELNDEKLFQEALVNTIGEFANNLPDYQKIEIMMFVMNKIPLPSDDVPSEYGDVLLQNMLLKSVLKVATKYSTVHMTTSFPYAFLDPLLRMSVAPDLCIRILVQQILHTLIDRHGNLPKLHVPRIPDDISDLDLTIEKCNHQDIMFIKKNGAEIFWHLYDNLQQENNNLEMFEAVYSTLALLCVELGNEEIMCELLRLTFGLQDMANSNTSLTSQHRCTIHTIVACYLNLICQLTAIPTLVQHVKEIISKRQEIAPYLLPDLCFDENVSQESFPKELIIAENLLFDKNVINETLRNTGLDTTRLMNPFVPNRSDISQAKSISDIHSISLDVDSVHSSPGVARKHPEEEVTFESLKKIMTESSEKNKEAEKEKRMQILETFRTAPFEDLVARSESKALQFHNKLNEIFSRLPFGVKECELRESSSLDKCLPNTTLYEVQFPDLFVF